MKKFKINDTWVYFPFVPYRAQEKFMTKMLEGLQKGQNALLESPTGTGKTLCLLGTSLAWLDNIRKIEEYESPAYQEETIRPKSERKHQIFFCSRTHSQLQQAISEFNKTGYGHLRAAVLTARKHLCLHKSALNAGENLENKCKKLREPTLKCVKTQPDIEDLPSICSDCKHEHQCPYYMNYELMKQNKNTHPLQHCGALDQKSLKAKCKEYGVCPFYVSRHLAKEADIIFLPYSYIFNPHILRVMELNLRNAVLIVDEGHNLEKVCEENASFEIKTIDISNCKEEVAEAEEHFDEDEFPEDVQKKDILELKIVINKLLTSFITLAEGTPFDGQHALNLFSEAGFDRKEKDHHLHIINQLIKVCVDHNLKFDGMKRVHDAVRTLYYVEESDSDHVSVLKESYVLHKEKLKEEDKKKKVEPKINLWCFDAGVIMRALGKKGVLSFIVTSGTLSPLDPLRKSLCIPFEVELINNHVIDQTQVFGISIGDVPDFEDGSARDQRVDLSSKFINREQNGEKYYAGLGYLVLEVARTAPKGLLIFFSSSKIKDDCLKRWGEVMVLSEDYQELSLYDAICAKKPIHEEPKQTFQLDDLQNKFNAIINKQDSTGAILIGIMSGKVSEGIDFKDDSGRAVIMVGLQYPPIFDPWVMNKCRYVRKKLGAAALQNWKLSVAVRPVNQALGRIIRHRSDYGVVILADQRFRDNYHINALPQWLTSSLKNIEYENLHSTLSEFFSTIHAEMQKVSLRCKQEHAETCHRHTEELKKEEVSSVDKQLLKTLQESENSRQINLKSECVKLRSKIQQKKNQISNLQREYQILIENSRMPKVKASLNEDDCGVLSDGGDYEYLESDKDL